MGQHHAAIYLEVNNKKILFDCGDGIVSQLLRNKLTGDQLDMIIISHFHPDHIAGIFILLQLLFLEKREKALSIYLPERPKDFIKSMQMMYLFSERFSYPLKIKKIDELKQDLDFIDFWENEHLKSYSDIITQKKYPNKMKCWSFLITENNKKLLYTSDLQKINVQKFKNADLIIIDAFHPDSSEINSLQKETKARIILNHISIEDIKKKKLNKELEIADEEKTIIL